MRSEMLCNDEVITLVSKWTIGASGAHTKATGCNGTGFTSVARTAAGQYTVTFARGVPFGKLVDFRVTTWKQASPGVAVSAHPIVGTFTAETAAAPATVKYETFDLDTPALTELASGDEVTLTAVFQKTK